MRPGGSSGWLRAAGLCLVASLAYGIAALNAGVLEVAIKTDIYSDTQIFPYRAGQPDASARSVHPLTPGTNLIRQRLAGYAPWQPGLRLDPLTHPGRFSIIYAKILRNVCLLPVPILNTEILTAGDTTSINGISDIDTGDFEFKADHSDPHLDFSIRPLASLAVATPVNFLVLMALSGICGLVRRSSGPAVRQDTHAGLVFAETASILMIAMAVAITSSAAYADIAGWARVAGWILVALAMAIAVTRGRGWLSKRQSASLLALIMLTAALLPDLAYRAGAWPRPVFSSFLDPIPYHWRIPADLAWVETNGSGTFDSEFREIGRIARPLTSVYSDNATTYYAMAALPVFGVNLNFHHQRIKSRKHILALQRLEDLLCRADVPTADLTRAFDRINKNLGSRGLPTLRYVLINNKRDHFNVGKSCLSLNNTASDNMARLVAPVFQGRYLTMFDLDNRPND